MEYADSGDLFKYIQQRPRLSEGDARWFFQQVREATGVTFAALHSMPPQITRTTSATVGTFVGACRQDSAAYILPKHYSKKVGFQYQGQIRDGLCLHSSVVRLLPCEATWGPTAVLLGLRITVLEQRTDLVGGGPSQVPIAVSLHAVAVWGYAAYFAVVARTPLCPASTTLRELLNFCLLGYVLALWSNLGVESAYYSSSSLE